MKKYLSTLLPFVFSAFASVWLAYFNAHELYEVVRIPRPEGIYRYLPHAIFFVGVLSSGMLLCIVFLRDLFSLLEKRTGKDDEKK